MTGFEYGRVLGEIQEANSLPALAHVRVNVENRHRGDRDLVGLLEMIEVKRKRLLGDLALGAAPKRIVGAVLRDGLGLAGVGIAIGAVGSVMASRVLRDMVAGVSDIDPITIALSAFVLLGVAAAACFAPARRAGAVDPVVTLSAE
jgi:putative ABC transport system permease protein